MSNRQTSPSPTTDSIISTILKHDRKTTSYKIALLRAINDVVLAFPDAHQHQRAVAIPLRLLAEYWVAYYWPFVVAGNPIWQGQRAKSGNTLRQDMNFRPQLTALRQAWEQQTGATALVADGFVLIHDLRLARKRASFSPDFLDLYDKTIQAISKALEYPIQHAGTGAWTIFAPPVHWGSGQATLIALPGTRPQDRCLVLDLNLWQTFQTFSLWVEALCLHEWSLYTERVNGNQSRPVDRGQAYLLLTERPDNRRPLTWERNQIDLMLLEKVEFTCPWTQKPIRHGVPYDLDHLVPLALYPTNELWNLIPSDPRFNMHQKRDRLPSAARLQQARPHLITAYSLYNTRTALAPILQADVQLRFTTLHLATSPFPERITQAVSDLIHQLTTTRNVALFT